MRAQNILLLIWRGVCERQRSRGAHARAHTKAHTTAGDAKTVTLRPSRLSAGPAALAFRGTLALVAGFMGDDDALE